MASGTSAAALLLPLLVLALLAAGARTEDDGGAIDSSPPTPRARARRAGPAVPVVVVDGAVAWAKKQGTNCPLIREPSLVDACRTPPGLRGCVAQCIVFHYRGGYCDMAPNGRAGDCYCTNCLATPGQPA